MTKLKDAGLSPALVETVAGLSAGTMATLIVHPLDIVKTRMQSESSAISCRITKWKMDWRRPANTLILILTSPPQRQ